MRQNKTILAASLSLIAAISTCSAVSEAGYKVLDQALQKSIDTYLAKYKQEEHISGAAMAVSLPNAKTRQYFAGETSHSPHATKINASHLYQIGSITKSYTAVIILQLEAEGKLSLNQTIGDWLPQYPAWKSITIKQLLNMTSGIPDYFNQKAAEDKEEVNVRRQWTVQEINALVYPTINHPLAYSYSNTNYWLAGMIIEKATGHSFETELKQRIIKPLKLHNTFYSEKPYNSTIMSRMVQGYYYDNRSMPKLYGKNTTLFNMSFAGPSGAIVADMPDVISWVKALFSTALYSEQQLQQLQETVSMKTGARNVEDNADGFGLGVIRIHHPQYGNFWYYEGETLGFRSLYMYKQCNNIIISINLNTAVNPDSGQDHITNLFNDAYGHILEIHPEYKCD